MANHVLYFWHDPQTEMAQILSSLRPGGVLALGYQLGQDMPPLARKRFPSAGHRLYASDDEVARLARSAGFRVISHGVKGPADAPQGRVMLAVA